MSAEAGVAADIVCCASCGIADVDNVTLKLCDAIIARKFTESAA